MTETPAAPPTGVRRTAGNIAALLTNDVINRAATFGLYLLVARHLGAFAFGQLSLALSLFYTFQVLSIAGLRTLLPREVSKAPEKSGLALANGTLVVGVFSLASIAILVAFTLVMGYAPETTAIIVLVSLGLLPYSLAAVCESLLQGWERMHLIAYANVPVSIGKVVLALVLLPAGGGLMTLGILLLVANTLILAIEWWLVLRRLPFSSLRIDLSFARDLVKQTSAFLGIDGLIAVRASVLIVILSKAASETEVGLYNAAAQLTTPLALIYQSIMLSVFPIMSRVFAPEDQRSLKRMSEYLIELLLAFGVPMVVGLFFLAEEAFLLIYSDEDFLLGTVVLQVTVWILLLRAFSHVLGRSLVAGLREGTVLRIVLIDAVITVALGYVLIARYGLIGAAIATLVVTAIETIQHYVPVHRRMFHMNLLSIIWKPAVAGLALAAYLVLAGNGNVFLTIAGGALVYAAAYLLLLVVSLGGPARFKARLAHLWSR